MKLRIWHIILILLGVSILLFFIFRNHADTPDWITTTVERGAVQNIVSVSGFVEARNTAELSFPVTGIVTDVFTEEGMTVQKGELLATLGSANLVAQRADAVGILKKAQATRDELVAGPTKEARALTDTTVSSAKADLLNVINTETEKVANAKAALFSADLKARTIDNNEDSTAPIISGSYLCSEEGTYHLSVFSSNAHSGFSYTLSGLESGTYSAGTKQAFPLGECGLLIQFMLGDRYNHSEWMIEIPNTKSTSYVTYKNAYDLSLKQQEQNIQLAQNAVSLAQDTQTYENAAPSNDALDQANASVFSAQARVSQIDAQIKDLSIIAPFSGIITDVTILPGETAGATPVITLLGEGVFELKARVPEIDITKILPKQDATIIFDAQNNETLTGALSFISPLATEIDGVAYFETTIELEQTPTWIRSGLNADIDIVTAEASNVLRIPKRYLITSEEGTHAVLTPNEHDSVSTPITVTALGNDGYVAITGLREGDVIIAP